jgi:glycosyltransferase involved in cell wall biosynthesis
MKILQVSNSYFPSVDGVAVHVRNISERIAKEHEVTVFTPNSSGMLPREEEINGVLVRRFKSFAPRGAYDLSFEMLAALRESQFDIVHGHNYHAFPLLFSRYAKKKKFIVTPHYHRHGVTPLRDILIKLYKLFGAKILEGANKVIAVSNFEKGLLNEDFRIDDDKITVIPNGVNWRGFNSLRRVEKSHKTILYVARLVEFKGVQYAIQVLPLLDGNIRLEILGKGPHKEKLVRLAKELGVEQRIDFYQDLHEKDLLDRYANADLFMLLSKYEAMSMAVAEALAARLPCIVANISALSAWIDNENCFGIDYPISLDQLAGLANKLIGKKIAGVELWDWNDVAKQLEMVYKT